MFKVAQNSLREYKYAQSKCEQLKSHSRAYSVNNVARSLCMCASLRMCRDLKPKRVGKPFKKVIVYMSVKCD